MATGWRTRAWAALAASLIVATSLLLSCAGADASGLSLSLGSLTAGTAVSAGAAPAATPLISVSLPSLPLPSEPGVSVSLPSVGVSIPSVNVSAPGVSVSTPSVNASLPSVSVSTSSTSGTTPGETHSGETHSGETHSGEAPASESPASHGASGGGAGGGASVSSSGPSSTDDGAKAVAASVDTASSTPHAAVVGQSSGTVGERARHRPTARSGPTTGHARPPGGNAVAPTVALAAQRLDITPASVSAEDGARRVAKHGTSNPLDSIGGHLPLPLPVPDWSKPIILLLLALAIWFAVRSRVVLKRARRLEEQRATLLRDVGVMQAALVPEIPARVGGVAVSVAYRPADGPAAGGDFYDVFVPERGKVAIILGDVAGHGHRALAHAALTRYTLRAYLQTGLEPRAALALAGSVLADPEFKHYATVAIGIYSVRDGCLTYASAGHPPPILHGLHTRQPVAICASPPVGWTVPTGRRQTTVSLPPGAVACFFSDGLIEARCEQDLLGRERVSEILAGLGARADATKLLARVTAAALTTPDDMAACVFVPEMTVVPARTHVEELEADAEDVGAGRIRRFLETCQVPAAEIEPAIARASTIVAESGSALLRVELSAKTATVGVSVPRPVAQAARDRRLRPGGQPVLTH
jgi:hypothetical protein